MIGKVE